MEVILYFCQGFALGVLCWGSGVYSRWFCHCGLCSGGGGGVVGGGGGLCGLGVFCPGGFVRWGFVRGVLSRGVLSRGVCPRGFIQRGLSGGVLSGGGGGCPRGFFVYRGALYGGFSPVFFVGGVLSGGGGCPRIYHVNIIACFFALSGK